MSELKDLARRADQYADEGNFAAARDLYRQIVMLAAPAREVLENMAVEEESERLQFLRILVDQYPDSAITALGSIRHQHALRTLLNALHTDAVEGAAEALARIGEEAVKPLIQKLTDTDSTTRLYAARSLGEIRDQRGVEPLLELLSDEDVLVRVHAALALGEIGDSRAVEPLILLLGDSDPNVRYSTSFALADLGDDRAVAPLIRTLQDNDESVRWSAARNLAALRDPRALEALI